MLTYNVIVLNAPSVQQFDSAGCVLSRRADRGKFPPFFSNGGSGVTQRLTPADHDKFYFQ